MKTSLQTLGYVVFLPVAVLTFSACCSTPKATGERASLTVTQPGVPGGVMLDTYTETATVKSIDKATRKVTLVAKDGTQNTVKVGPQVVNFDQIKVGDLVKTTMTEQLVVFVRKAGAPSGDGAAAMVVRAPQGEKPGVLLADTEELTAKVKSIDVKHQKATLLFPDGTIKTVKVRKDVDLTNRTVGEEIVFRTTSALVLSVEKP